MEKILNDIVSNEELKKYERIYNEQLKKEAGSITIKAQFEYAWCLVRSKFPADIKKGIMMLENLYNHDVEGRRDYLYYLSVGNIRIKEYSKALKFCRGFLEIEPTNSQVQELEKVITKKINKEGTIGIAITMAGILIVGALVSAGAALCKGKS
ncbi:hypothetical protein RUM44_007450 [Polyplax serrata]|uniref:Mitochondrial fission 1 protein n=1 Tax=Polyplax serrata TaxID=468196 RepID=A0ABR1B0Q6_POLSC